MKFVIAALLGLVSAVHVEQKVAESIRKRTKASKLITIDLKKTNYTSEKSKMALTQVPQEMMNDLVQTMGFPTIASKSGAFGLAQKSPFADIDLKNYKNMGYEGTFYFGTHA